MCFSDRSMKSKWDDRKITFTARFNEQKRVGFVLTQTQKMKEAVV